MSNAEKPFVLREGPPPRLGASALPGWKLEDAKAKFSELVRRARSEGAQRVTHRGKDAVIILAVEEYEQMLQGQPPAPREQNLVEFLQGLGLHELDLERSRDTGRDIDL